MCGIAGRVTPGEPADAELLDRMCRALRHRGPDDQGTHVDGCVGLGMRRLAIVDLADGRQPMYSEDGRIVLVFNGEIYNQEGLREELQHRGHTFVSRCDAEVVVHLWEELGPRCVQRLRGMFAFAIWDGSRNELFLARDRVGKKPLYYAERGGNLTFASEARAILQAPDIPRDVDLAAIDAYLVNQYVPHDLCAFQHIRKLPPAATLRWRPGSSAKLERYWRLEYGPKETMSAEDCRDRLRAAILDATRVRLMSDVPVGAFLSGGVDSSVIVAAMARTSPGPVRTFTVAFPGMPSDEGPYARRIAEHYGTEHHELEVGPATTEVLPRLAWHFGEPFADPAALPTFHLAEAMRKHVVVALNGDGGDESFAGYRRYRQLLMTRSADRLPSSLRSAVARVLRGAAGGTDGRRGGPRAARLAHRLALSPPRRYADLFRYFTDDDRQRVYGPQLREVGYETDPLAHIVNAWEDRDGLHDVDRLMAVDLVTYLSDDLLAKVDVCSMAQSLEVRSPLLDQELMELAARFSPGLKLRKGQAKVSLRDAARGWVPDEILDRPKQGFAVPLGRWLREELRSLPEDVLLDRRTRDRELFDTREVRKLIEEHHAGRPRQQKLWAMINLELWFRTCVDRVISDPADLPALP